MLKLQELKKKQQQQQAQAQAKKEEEQQQQQESSNTSTNSDTQQQSGESTGYILKRENSKELAEKRKQKSKENVFTLKKSGGGKKDNKKKQNAAELRVQKDLSEMDPIPGTRLDFPDSNNVMNFSLFIIPSDGLYRGAEFKFNLTIPQTYPYDPPKAVCETPIYHPNIDWEGHVSDTFANLIIEVCLNILRADWMPVLNLGSVVFGLVTLFLQPNPDDPLNKEVAQLMIDNRTQFERNVKQSLQGGYVGNRQYPKLLK